MVCIKTLLSRRMQFWPPRQNFPCSLREGYKFNTFSGNPFFISPQSDPLDTKDALPTTWPKSFRQKAEIVSLKLQKVWKQHKLKK